MIVLGGALTGVKQFDGPMPINKNLWTLSYSLLTSGFAFLVLLFLFSIIDVWRIWTGAPFFYVGMNSMLIYLLHLILIGQTPWCGGECTGLDTHGKQMASQIGAVAVWTCYSYYVYRNKFFLII